MANLPEQFGPIDIYLFDQLLRGNIRPGMRIFDAGCGGGRNLIYLLRHKSREAARESWAKFSKDPEWVALKAETEKDGVFVVKHDITFMKLTDFSPKI